MPKKYFCPLPLQCTLDRVTFFDGSVVRKIADQELSSLFGIRERTLDEKLNIISVRQANFGAYSFGDSSQHIENNTLNIFSSNYMFEFANEVNKAVTLNGALKLLSLSKSGLYIGFRYLKNHTDGFYCKTDGRATEITYLGPNPYYKEWGFSELTEENKDKFVDLYNSIGEFLTDKRFVLMLEKFLFSLSGCQLTLANRFVELMTILEMLFFPDQVEELTYRLSLRVAKVFKQLGGEDAEEKFDHVCELYKIRSGLVHTGSSNKLNESTFNDLAELVRKALNFYIKNKDRFKSAELNKACLL